MKKNHAERAHSKFSASGAERWLECPGSVEASEGMPDKSSVWSLEGTKAHEVLETILVAMIEGVDPFVYRQLVKDRIKEVPEEMFQIALQSASFIYDLYAETPDSEIMVETRVYLDFIHPEMFGTYDGAVIDHFGTLHVFDFKYGAGHAVSPVDNYQMIFYGIGLAYKFKWNFKNVRLWIIQPRIKGYDGPVFWDVPVLKLQEYVEVFKAGVKRVEESSSTFVEGSWCHWCKAKSKCPLKLEAKIEEAKTIFTSIPIKPIIKKGAKSRGKKESSKEKGNEEDFF